MRNAIFYCLLVLFIGCQSTENQDYASKYKSIAEDFFKTFSEREDWEKLCSFYAVDMEFEDVTLQIKLDSLWQFKKFYKWDEEENIFEKMSPDQEHLNIETLVVDGDVAVARGNLNPFFYAGRIVDVEWGMQFTIWLYFNEHGKIQRQVDWFEYDPDVLDGVIRHFRENGMDVLPAWLNLEKVQR